MQAAHHILGPWGVDSDLRRWGMKLAEHEGKRGKKRAVIAVARKLAVLLHRLWVSAEVYVPLRPAVGRHCQRWQVQSRPMEVNVISRVPVTASLPWPDSLRDRGRGRHNRWRHRLNREHPLTPSDETLTSECGWKGDDRRSSACQKSCSHRKEMNLFLQKTIDTDRPSHGGHCTHPLRFVTANSIRRGSVPKACC